MFLDCKDNVYISESECVPEIGFFQVSCLKCSYVQVGYDWGQWSPIVAPPWAPMH